MKKSIKYLLIILFVLGCAGYGAYYLLRPVQVETVRLKLTDVYDYLDTDGTVISRNETAVSSKVFGVVAKKYVQDGDPVEKGQLLLSLDAGDLKNQIKVLESQMTAGQEEKNRNLKSLLGSINLNRIMLQQLEADIEAADRNVDKAETLYEQGEIAREDLLAAQEAYSRVVNQRDQVNETLGTYEDSYAAVKGAGGSLSALKYQKKILEDQLKHTKIYATAKGIITNLAAKEGGIVTNQAPLAEIVSPEDYEIETFILTDEAINQKVGDPVKLTVKVNGIDKEYKGTIRSIGQIAKEMLSPLGLLEKKVKVTIQPEEAMNMLRIGYDVKVKLVREYKEGAIAIPKTSVFYREDQKLVYLDRGGKVAEVVITTGMDTDTDIVVEKGLKAGDILIRNYKVDGLAVGKKIK